MSNFWTKYGDFKQCVLTLLSLPSRKTNGFWLANSFKKCSLLNDFQSIIGILQGPTYQPPPTTTTAKPISENIENLIMYQKAFAAVIKDVRKHFDKAEDLAMIDPILQDLEITRLKI